jgi:putative YphP/YqiW family bacilliredoxin
MQFGKGVGPDTDWMRKELTDLGVEELTTPEEVDEAMDQYGDGTMLLVINSVCGCAAGNARPAVKIALDHEHTPDHMTTVFAGQDKEATERARSYFSDYPPSSPAFAFFKDGEIKAMIPRHRIERRTKEEIAKDLKMVFDAYCEVESSEA